MGRPLTEDQKQHLRDVWAAKRAAKTDVDTNVADVKLSSAEVELHRLNGLIAGAKERLEAEIRKVESVEKSQAGRTNRAREYMVELENSLALAKENLADVETDINNRKIYRERQERAIEETVNKGNDRLYEVDQEVKEALRKRDDIHLKSADLERQKAALEGQIAELQETFSGAESKINELKFRYLEAADAYRAELTALRATIEEEKDKLTQLRTKADAITDELASKSNAVASRESALATKEAELVSRERLLKSRESRYALD